jgi:carbon monoxide dehydrogenase subunit G
VEQSAVTFTVDGVHEPVKGGGNFRLTVSGPTETKLTFAMSLVARGLMAPVINPLLNKMAPGMCDEFVATLSAHMLKGKAEA